MNLLDVIIIIPLLWSLYRGYKSGVVTQASGLIGLVAGVFLAYYLGGALMSWLGVNSPIGRFVAYVAIGGVIIFSVIILARMISGAINAAGLGIIDQVLGAALSLVKMWLIVSLLLCGLNWYNTEQSQIVEPKHLEGSLLYKPMINSASYIFPYADFAREKVEQWVQEDDEDSNPTTETSDSTQGDR